MNLNLKKKISLLSLTLALSFSLVACSTTQSVEKEVKKDKQVVEEFKPEQTKYPLKIKDSSDREVTIESEPGSIVSLAPNITETLYAINRGAKLVSRTDFDNYPQPVERIQSIGTPSEPNIDKIIEMKPNLVLASNFLKEEALEKLEKAGIKVAVFDGEDGFSETYEMIKNVGIAINAQQEAKTLITDMQKKVEEVTTKVKEQPEKSVYYVSNLGEGAEFNSANEAFLDQIISMAGGKNVVDKADDWKFSIEKLIEKNPDILVVSNIEGEKEKLMKANGYKDLTSVKEEKVYAIDETVLNRQGPRLAEGLEELAKIIHPDAFK